MDNEKEFFAEYDSKCSKKKFFLYGGSFLKRLAPYIDREIGNVTGMIIGPSPFSHNILIEDGTEGYSQSWLNLLDKALTAQKPNYFIFDLQRAISILFEENGILASPLKVVKPNDILPKRYQLVDPLLLSRKQRHLLLDQFIAIARKYFDSEHMILLHTTYPRYYVKNNHIQDYTKQKSLKISNGYVTFLKECEKYIVEKTQCHFIDISKFYFGLKEKGKRLTNVIFETYCYEDTVNCIENIICGNGYTSDRPSFKLSMLRRNQYRTSFYTKAFLTFLNHNYFLDHLVASASDAFINKYFQDLLLLDTLDWNDVKKALAESHDLDIKPELFDILYTFSEIRLGNYHSVTEENYAAIFKEGIVTDELIMQLENHLDRFNCIKRQIKSENAGYYFALLHEYDTIKFANQEMIIRPIKIDIFGSCVSRFCFSIDDSEFAVDGYWFHIPTYESNSSKITYPSNIFGETLNWVDKLAKLQLDNGVLDDIKKASGEWLIVDMYSFISPHLYNYNGILFTNTDDKIAKKIHAKKINIFDLYDFDKLMEMSEKWFNLVLEKYNNRIILLNGALTSIWIGDNHTLYFNNIEYPNNNILQKTFEYFAQRLKCYTIDLNPLLIADDTGFFNRAAIHKEDVCYTLTHNVIRNIIINMPKQKHYDHIPGIIQVDRILRLIQTNSLYAMERVFHHTYFDSIVIRMDYQLISLYRKNIAEIYDLRFPDYKTMMQNFSFDDCIGLKKVILEIASNMKPATPVELKTDYSKYKDEEEIYEDISSDYNVQPISKPLNFKCIKTLDGFHLSWDKIENADMYVIHYRNTREGRWKRIVNLSKEVCCYDHVINCDEIWYSLKGYRIVGKYQLFSPKAVLYSTAK